MKQVSEMVVTYVANALWMTCVIAAAAVLLTRALRRCPSSYRHGLWVAALLLAVLLPTASFRGSHNTREATTAFSSTENSVESAAGMSGRSSWSLWRMRSHRSVLFGPLVVGLMGAFYSGFILYRGVRLGRGWLKLRTMLKRSGLRAMPSERVRAAEQCHSLLGVKPVAILLSREGHGPATLGIRNPVLVLPEWFVSRASEEDFSSALCHELAHIRRHDFLFNLIYELLLLPISFHPAAALIKARIDQTRELACDELAAESFSAPAQYARSLLSIAQSMAKNQPATNAGYALGLLDTNTLEERIMNVFAKTNRIRKSAAQASGLAALVLLLVTGLGVSVFSLQVTQPKQSDATLQQFVGTWQAKFKGKTFLTIKLQNEQDKLTGTASRADVQANDAGELISAKALDGSDPILEAKLTSGILRITAKDGDSKDTVQFDIKLTGNDQGEIQIVIPPDVATVKPWKLERAKAGK
jgi:beta-lactamase regulating signal transducer with metallopeptidase domain